LRQFFDEELFHIHPIGSIINQINGVNTMDEVLVDGRAAKRIRGPRGKRERRGPLGEKRGENIQGLDINFGK